MAAAVWRSGTVAEQAVQQQSRRLGVKCNLIKSLKLPWKTKESGEVWEIISLRFEKDLFQNSFISLLFFFFLPGPNLARASAEHSLLGRPRTYFRLTSVPRGIQIQNPFERQID